MLKFSGYSYLSSALVVNWVGNCCAFELQVTTQSLGASVVMTYQMRNTLTHITHDFQPSERVEICLQRLNQAYSIVIDRSAICVQRFDDSLNPTIHITYRISWRSSSYKEPRDPSLRDIWFVLSLHQRCRKKTYKFW